MQDARGREAARRVRAWDRAASGRFLESLLRMEAQSALFNLGYLDDRLSHLPSNYAGWAPPAKGGGYTDPAYGTPIFRMSNGLAELKDAVHHEYATMSPFNCDNTRVLLLTDRDGFFVVDILGNILVPPDSQGKLNLSGLSDPRWSLTDPNVFYYHDKNEVRKFDVAKKSYTVVRTFSQFTNIDFGGGESDISEDGTNLVLIGDNRLVGVYNIPTDTLGPTIDITGHTDFDYFDMTPNNNVIVRWGSGGTGRFQGFELFDKNMNFIRQVYPYTAHADRGRDLNGDELLIILAATDLNPPAGCEGNGIEKVRLSDGKKTCLLPLNWESGVHISANSNGKNPWVLVSTVDELTGTMNPTATLPANWQSRWKTYFNELILVKLDGSEVRRVAHHRSRTYDTYWFYPRAAMNREGTFAIFDSNFGTNPMAEYTDSFLVSLQSAAQTSVSAANYTGTTLASESIATAFGLDLSTSTLAAPVLPLPTALSGTQILVRDSGGAERMAPLFFVSNTQVNYQIPAGTAPGAATITITSGARKVSSGTAQIGAVAPGLFSANATGQGLAVGNVLRVKSDGTQAFEAIARFDSAQNRFVSVPIDLSAASDQVYLVLYGTGFRNRSALSGVSATIGGTSAQVLFAGATDTFVGLDQLNLRLPASLAGRGDVEIQLTVDGKLANKVTVTIK